MTIAAVFRSLVLGMEVACSHAKYLKCRVIQVAILGDEGPVSGLGVHEMQSALRRLQRQIVEPGSEAEEESAFFSSDLLGLIGTVDRRVGSHRSKSVGGIIDGCGISKVGLQGMRIAVPVSESTSPPSKGWSGTTLFESYVIRFA
jgi:hypothetical protein